MKWVVKEDIGVAKLYNDEFTKDLLTLYWGEKWGHGEGFTVCALVGGVYYNDIPIEADSIEEAKYNTEIWFCDILKNTINKYMEYIDYYDEISKNLTHGNMSLL